MILLLAFLVVVVALGISIFLATGAPHYKAIARRETRRRKELEHMLADITMTASKAADVDPVAQVIMDTVNQLGGKNDIV